MWPPQASAVTASRQKAALLAQLPGRKASWGPFLRRFGDSRATAAAARRRRPCRARCKLLRQTTPGCWQSARPRCSSCKIWRRRCSSSGSRGRLRHGGQRSGGGRLLRRRARQSRLAGRNQRRSSCGGSLKRCGTARACLLSTAMQPLAFSCWLSTAAHRTPRLWLVARVLFLPSYLLTAPASLRARPLVASWQPHSSPGSSCMCSPLSPASQGRSLSNALAHPCSPSAPVPYNTHTYTYSWPPTPTPPPPHPHPPQTCAGPRPAGGGAARERRAGGAAAAGGL
jgi:hypothetical protein